jgi:hypothetical protein
MSIDKIQKIIPDKIHSVKLERLANYKSQIFNNNINNLIKNKFNKEIPSLSGISSPKITEEILLEIYNIVTLDDLRIHINDIKKNNNIVYYKNGKTYILSNNTFNEFIELGDSIENFIPFENINRIVQAWVWVNFNDLKTHSNSFCEFTIDIIKITLKKDIHNKPELNKHIKDFVKYWFTKHDKTEFSLDLLTDLNKYLNEIY